ncbi:MAG: hypothetical protein ABJK64_17815, partial [Paraglaciecola sp.]|uniref:hypothetical protein n=1 Tax=Paraglaciecola sp. TaxID=1920173 RepID=UPI003299F02F
RFFITDKRGKEVFKTKKLGSNYDYQYAFTPLKSGNYTINVEGLSGHGYYEIMLNKGHFNE